jgi:tetratricopeptide (TPR) repeat protein
MSAPDVSPAAGIFIQANPPPLIQSHPWISIFLIGFAMRPVVILLHLLGHAIIAIAVTNQKTTIYLGSHGDQQKSAKVNIGLLEVWFTVVPLLWQKGLCVPTDKIVMKVDQKLSYTLTGPLLPVVVSGILLLGSAVIGFGEYSVMVMMGFFGASVIDLFINFTPVSKPLAVVDHRPLFNDGYMLRLLLTQKEYPTEFFVGIEEFSKHEYASAAKHFEKAARMMPQKKAILRNLLESYKNAGDLYKSLNDHIAAENYYLKAKELTPRID